MNIQDKIKRALKTNKLNPVITGERNWYKYFIRTTELIWARNLQEGYKIEVYSEQYGKHLTTIIVK